MQLNNRKCKKQDLSDSSLSNSDLSDESDHKRNRRDKKRWYRKRKKHDPVKLCEKLMAKFLTTAYKLKVLKLKSDEDPLQHRIFSYLYGITGDDISTLEGNL